MSYKIARHTLVNALQTAAGAYGETADLLGANAFNGTNFPNLVEQFKRQQVETLRLAEELAEVDTIELID